MNGHHKEDQRAAGVNVELAEAEFAELSRHLSSTSQPRSGNKERSGETDVSHNTNGDLEKGEDAVYGGCSQEKKDEESFDLEAMLRGAKSEDEEAGVKSKQIGVLWDGLTVSGFGGTKVYVKTFLDAVTSLVNLYGLAKSLFGLGKRGNEANILTSFRGLVKPGEMVLVLGKPGSGCSTFLKVIANQRQDYTHVDGEVLYGPFDSNYFAKRYRGEAVYNGEEDVHHSTLTVGQTLGFALDTKIPGKLPGGLSKREFKEKVIKLLLRMFNIEHTRNTVIGDHFVRGISGGERKRVSIAEMMVTRATVCSYDNSTRGLDASTALDYAKSLRLITNIYKTSTFVSLYQASENIYDQFDKVLVIDEGRMVYFGAASEARKYFRDLGYLEKPRQTTPDFLTACTEPYEREYQEGKNKKNVPSTPQQLSATYDESDVADRIRMEMAEYRQQMQREKHVYEEFQLAVAEGKRRASKRSVYSIPLYTQIWVLVRRQTLLKWQDRFSLTVSWITTLFLGVMLGTVWLDLPQTTAGAFPRGGLLFISLLFSAFQAFGELIATVLGRGVLNKHKAYTFHRPSALWLANIVVDMLFASVRSLIFSILVYFLCGLARDAGAFFIFYLLILSGYVAMTLLFRTIAILSRNFDVAVRSVSLVITLFVITTGYYQQYGDQPVWLRWIFYINAVGLGFSALMMNEFSRLTLTCTDESLVPSGPSYSDVDYQTCTIAGSRPGSNVVDGNNYVLEAFSYNPNDLWRNWGIMFSIIVLLVIANLVLGEFLNVGAAGKPIITFARENKKLKALNEAQKERRLTKREKGVDDMNINLQFRSKAVLTWENICYYVPAKSGDLQLLDDIFGYIKPGQLTALMGASGAGKTTLLDVLAARKTIGKITGLKLIDGREPSKAFQRQTSYAEQLDILEPTSTVREALRFSADLRQSYTTSRKDKYAYVEDVISLLEMEDIAEAIIGVPESGLAMEQRKRVTIGVELAAKPDLLLFLDEPTTGLDSQGAFNIVRFLKKLALSGQAVLCTIHQPNSVLFDMFDRLLLLQRGGQTVYFGEVGKDAQTVIEYFGRYGAYCPTDANPAEFMLDAIGAGQSKRIGSQDWADIWRESAELASVKSEIADIKRERFQESYRKFSTDENEYATPLWYQCQIVCQRACLNMWRSADYGVTRILNHLAVSLPSGLIFMGLGDSRTSMQSRFFVALQVTVLPAIILAQVEPRYAMARMLSYREQAAKAYKQFPFALSQVIAETPYSILAAIVFFLPLYYISGLKSGAQYAGYTFLAVLVTEIFAVTLGQMIAALTPSPIISGAVNPFIIVIFFIFCGVTIPPPQIPGFWKWLHELDPFTRLISGTVTTELQGREVDCADDELNRFTSPRGITCGEYMEDFFQSEDALGYLADPEERDVCEYCAFASGEEFYSQFGFEYGARWRDMGIFIAFIGSNLVILFLAARYVNFNRR